MDNIMKEILSESEYYIYENRYYKFCDSTGCCEDCKYHSDSKSCKELFMREIYETEPVMVSSRITNNIEQEPKTKTDVAMEEIIKKLDAIIKHLGIEL